MTTSTAEKDDQQQRRDREDRTPPQRQLGSKRAAEKAELTLIEQRLNCQAELKIKLLLMGDSLTGKTSLVSRFANAAADIESLKQTMLGDFHHFTVAIGGGKCAHVRVWDMGGAEKFHQTDLLADFYRDVDGVLLVFALDDFESYSQLPRWLERLQRHQQRPLSQLDCCLLANKSDLSAKRLVSSREAEAFARHHGLPYIEASALAVDNVQKAFLDVVLAVDRRRQLAQQVMEQQQQQQQQQKQRRISGRRRLPQGGCVDVMALCCGCGGRGAGERV